MIVWPRFNSVFHRLNRDERGTALTEFVIILPVFIIVFAGLLKLRTVGNEAVEHQVRANKKLWVAVYEAEDDEINMSPRGDLVDAFGPGEQSILNRLDAAVSGFGGHWGESYSRSALAMPVLTGRRVPTPLRNKLTMRPYNVIGDATVVNTLTNDTVDLSGLDTSGGIAGTIVNGALRLLGVSAGYAANIRYGNAYGELQVDEIEVAGIEHRFETSYQSLISPAQKPPFNDFMDSAETRSYLMSRLVGESETNYAELMDFIDQDLSTNRSDRYNDVPYWRY